MANLMRWFLQPGSWLFIAAIIAALAGLRINSDSNKFQKEISRLTSENLKKNEELAKLSIDTLNSITGDDSYVFLRLGKIDIIDAQHSQARLRIECRGKYPMYDVQLNIFEDDYEANLQGHRLSPNIIITRWPGYLIGTLRPGEGAEIGFVDFGDKNIKTLNTQISARNGRFTGMIKLERMSTGKWSASWVAWRVTGDKLEKLEEYSSTDFPQ